MPRSVKRAVSDESSNTSLNLGLCFTGSPFEPLAGEDARRDNRLRAARSVDSGWTKEQRMSLGKVIGISTVLVAGAAVAVVVLGFKVIDAWVAFLPPRRK